MPLQKKQGYDGKNEIQDKNTGQEIYQEIIKKKKEKMGLPRRYAPRNDRRKVHLVIDSRFRGNDK